MVKYFSDNYENQIKKVEKKKRELPLILSESKQNLYFQSLKCNIYCYERY